MSYAIVLLLGYSGVGAGILTAAYLIPRLIR